jgi:predicted amidohydrolase
VVGVNRIGTDGNGREYSGDSAAIAPDGEVVFEKKNEACCETVRLSRERLDIYRREFPAWKDADADLLRLPDDTA